MARGIAAANTQTTSVVSPGSAASVAIVGQDSVKVPNWILSDTTLEVVFNDRATSQIDKYQINRVSFQLNRQTTSIMPDCHRVTLLVENWWSLHFKIHETDVTVR